MTNLFKSIFTLGLCGFIASCENKASSTPAAEIAPTPEATVKNTTATVEKTTDKMQEAVKEKVDAPVVTPPAPKTPAAGAPT